MYPLIGAKGFFLEDLFLEIGNFRMSRETK